MWIEVCRWAFIISIVSALAFFFLNDTATSEIYTLSLHDALPISARRTSARRKLPGVRSSSVLRLAPARRSEEHTSELQSHHDLVCRLLLEKKKSSRVEAAVVVAVALFSAMSVSVELHLPGSMMSN